MDVWIIVSHVRHFWKEERMKKIFVSALVCAIAIACSVGVQAACPAHGSKSITTTCAGYPNSCEVRKCSIGSHPSDCQTQRYSNYGLESCGAKMPDGSTCKYSNYTSLHLCYVIHNAVSGSDHNTSYCPYWSFSRWRLCNRRWTEMHTTFWAISFLKFNSRNFYKQKCLYIIMSVVVSITVMMVFLDEKESFVPFAPVGGRVLHFVYSPIILDLPLRVGW